MAIYPVILCGGSGTRLWPASRPDRPKQFLKLIGDRSSFQETLLRLDAADDVKDAIIVTGAGMLHMVQDQAAEIGKPITVLVEPEARDSGPAVAAAAAYVESIDPEGVVLMLAADHHVAGLDAFGSAVAAARESVSAALVEGEVVRLDKAAFGLAPKKSLDYAVMERTQKATVAPATFAWSDLGAWDAIWEASERDEHGNARSGDVSLTDSRGVLIRSGGPFVGAFGVTDLLIVAEPDAVMVARRDDAQAVKALVDALKAAGRSIAFTHPISARAGVTRKVLAEEAGASIELWKLEAGAEAELPEGEHQLLSGALEGDGELIGRIKAAEATSLVVVRKG
jgi:mannose-1-phosphate guanylyltransferase